MRFRPTPSKQEQRGELTRVDSETGPRASDLGTLIYIVVTALFFGAHSSVVTFTWFTNLRKLRLSFPVYFKSKFRETRFESFTEA